MGSRQQARGRQRFGAFRYGVVAIALCAAVAGTPTQSVAWADSTDLDSTTSAAAQTAPAHRAGPGARKAGPDSDIDAGRAPKRTRSAATAVKPAADQPDLRSRRVATPQRRTTLPIVTLPIVGEPAEDHSAARLPAAELVAEPVTTETADIAPTALTVVTTPTTARKPPAPEPLSPLAQLLELPGRFVNSVLQFLDLTMSSTGPQSPFNLAPINDLVFAAFREVERWFGLDRTPPPQPSVPTLTYTGSTTASTPTVAQFLNAATAEYGLGTTPAGMVPFTVNGFQLAMENTLTGAAAKTWVTPEGQIIIAYSGTTGGTNLLFNPFIAVSQILADLQMILTNTTPRAMDDALDFARRVQDAAAKQGYDSEDIFVTGHSLGGWEAQYVAQQIGLPGIGFEGPGLNTSVPGNGADAMFVNIGTYGDPATLMATDLPGLQPFMPPYVPGGGVKPHYGPIVMLGDPASMTPILNAATLWDKGLIGTLIFTLDFLGNFQYHLPGVQAYHLDVTPDPGVVPWMGTFRGPVLTGYGDLTIPELLQAASDAGNLFPAAAA